MGREYKPSRAGREGWVGGGWGNRQAGRKKLGPGEGLSASPIGLYRPLAYIHIDFALVSDDFHFLNTENIDFHDVRT